jgi:hypothetical protein
MEPRTHRVGRGEAPRSERPTYTLGMATARQPPILDELPGGTKQP